MVRVAIVGAGRWGMQHVRAFGRTPGCEVRAVCDPSEEALGRARALAPQARFVGRAGEVFEDPGVEAVVLATPAKLHAEMAIAALGAGKHVLVEKPLALSGADAARVAAAAARSGRALAVGHLMLHHPVVARMREIVRSGEIGEVFYLYALRVNLGTVRRDENAMWSLAPHDLSMIFHLLGEAPVSVTARGGAYLQPRVPDVVFLNLLFRSGVVAQIQNSWLDPRKERQLTVVGSKKMMRFDDVRPQHKLQIFDRGYDREPAYTEYAEFLTMRSGEVHVPSIAMVEPLLAQATHFVRCVREGTPPVADAASGLAIVRVLEAAERSLAEDGAPVVVANGA